MDLRAFELIVLLIQGRRILLRALQGIQRDLDLRVVLPGIVLTYEDPVSLFHPINIGCDKLGRFSDIFSVLRPPQLLTLTGQLPLLPIPQRLDLVAQLMAPAPLLLQPVAL